ncbi:MAG: hypothetical protein B6I18_02800, partial [Bacteroidetes bacterium 4572_112]
KELNNENSMGACCGNIATIYTAQGDYSSALEYNQKALSIFEKVGNKDYTHLVRQNIGHLYYKMGDNDKALSHYFEAVEYYTKTNNNIRLVLLYQNIVALYIAIDEDSLALDYSERLIPLCKSAGAKQELTNAYINLGIIQRNLGNSDLAKKNYIKALSAIEKTDDLYANWSVNYSLAQLYIDEKKYNMALDYAYKSNESAIIMGRLSEKAQSAQILSHIYKKMNNYKKAYDYYVIFKTTKDSILNESNIKEITNLENQYKFDKEKEAIATEQAKKDAIQAEELKRQKVVRNSFIIGFVLMIVFAFIIFRNLAQKRKANRLLAEQKEEIETQSEELKTTNEKLVELDHFKQGLTSMIVHDLKNPLNGILNVSKSYSPENQVVQMKQIGKQMLNMVLNILDINKFEDSQMTVDKTSISLAQIAHAAISGINFLTQQKNLTIDNTIPPTIVVNADREIIERVFTNLLTNAIKYTPNNGKISLQAEITDTKQKFVKISVSDTGEGISQDKLHLVFAKFGQVSAKKSGSVRSTGLGLTFCKMAVEAHEGKIDVKSELNKGTTFWFTLQATNDELVQQPEKQVLEVKSEKLSLNADEKKILKPYITQFEKTEIYKMLELRKILRQITANSDNIQKWKKEMQQAIRSGNQRKYNKLLNI